jgi:hypothetical protein
VRRGDGRGSQFFGEELDGLLAHVRANARLDQLPKGATDGVTQRVHLEQGAARGIASAVAELARVPDCPESVAYLLTWTLEIGRGRSVGMQGVSGISYMMIDAWSRLTGRSLSASEIDAVFAIDAAMLAPGAGEEETA